MNYFLKKYLHLFSLFTLLTFAQTVFAANAVIDVMVVYTKGVVDLYGGDPTTRFNQVFQSTNQIYKDSGVNLEIRLVKTLQVDYTDDNSADIALNDITSGKAPAFSGVAAAREQAKADMVVLYRPYKATQGSCGIAWVGGQDTNGDFSNPYFKGYMFAHVGISSCGDYVTAHELGHNMGLKHSRKQDGTGGTFPYALGYGIVNKFTTIMAYQSEFNVDYWTGKLYKFSNPALTCLGVPCGVDKSDTVNGADAHYALNITGPQIANFYAAASVSSASSAKSSSAVSSTKSSSAVSSAKSSSVASSAKVSSSSSSLKPASSVASSKASSSVAVVKSSASSVVTKNSSSSKAASSVASSKPASSVASSKASSASSSSKSTSSSAAIVFKRVADVAQYQAADWTNEVRRDVGLTLDQAKAIAAANPKISYFVYTKGVQMVLSKGVFRTGDTVFFTGKPWYGSAPGLADAYEKP